MTARIARTNPRRFRLSNGRHGGWVPSRPKPNKDWKLSDVLGPLPRGAIENPMTDPKFYPRMRDQDEQGSCGGHSARTILAQCFREKHHELINTKWGEDVWDLSPAAIYFLARREDNSVYEDSGVWNRLLWDAVRKYGAPTEHTCPYNPKKLVTKLSATALKSASWHKPTPRTFRVDEDGRGDGMIDRMLQALANGMPLQIGFTCFDNLGEADDSGVVPMPLKTSKEDGGHDVAGQWADTISRLFWGANSWGEWGGRAPAGAKYDERGYIGIPFEFAKLYADDIWAVDIA